MLVVTTELILPRDISSRVHVGYGYRKPGKSDGYRRYEVRIVWIHTHRGGYHPGHAFHGSRRRSSGERSEKSLRRHQLSVGHRYVGVKLVNGVLHHSRHDSVVRISKIIVNHFRYGASKLRHAVLVFRGDHRPLLVSQSVLGVRHIVESVAVQYGIELSIDARGTVARGVNRLAYPSAEMSYYSHIIRMLKLPFHSLYDAPPLKLCFRSAIYRKGAG